MKINLLPPKSLFCLTKSILLRLLLFVFVILGTQVNAQSVSITSSDADNIICAGTSVTFTATPVDEGTTVSYQWYVGTTPVGTDSVTFTTSALTNGQTVSVVMNSDATDYPSDNDISTTVIELPNAGTNGTLTVCAGTTPTEPQLFAQLGGTPDAGGTWTNVGLVYTYTVSATLPCTGTDTATVTVTEQAAPNAGTNGTLTVCEGTIPTDSELFAALGGTPDTGGTWSNSGLVYTYTVSATLPCTGTDTATVTLTEQAAPNAGTDGTLTVCEGTISTDSELFAALGGTPDAGGTWSNVGLVYTYTVSATSPCTGTDTATVTVTEQAQPNAGTNGTLTVCAGTTPTEPQLFAQLGGTPDAGGTWSNVGLVYTYTVSATLPCTGTGTATVTVTEQAAPNAGTDGTLTVCEGTIPTDSELFAALGGTPDAGGTWSNVGLVYTYTVAATSPCSTDATATVTLTEQAAPNAGTDGTLTVCEGTIPTDSELFAALGGTPEIGGTWSNVGLVYTYTVSATLPCSTDATATVTLTEQAAPNAGTDGTLTVCEGTIPTDSELFAQLGGTPDVGGTWSNVGLVYTYTVDAIEPCTVAATATVTVTERAADAGHVSGISSDGSNDYPFENNVTVCSGNNDITLTLLNSYGNIQWMYSVSAAGTYRTIWGQTSNTLVLPKNIIGNGTIYYFAKVSCSTDVYTNKIAVTVLKSIAGTITGAGAVCSGGTKTLTLGTHAGTVQWQSSLTNSTNDSDWEDVGGVDSSSFTTPALTETTYYRVKVVNGSCDYAISPSVAVTISQSALSGTLSGTNTVCYGNGTTLELVGSSGIIKWQKSTNYVATPLAATWTTINNSLTTPITIDGLGGSTLGTGNLTVSMAYRAQITSGSCVTYTDVYIVAVTPVAKAGTVSTPTTSVCQGSAITFSLIGSIGSSYKWQTSLTASGSPWSDVGTGATYDAIASSLSTLYVRCVVSNSCTAATTAVKTIFVNKPSVAGTITGGGTVCSSSVTTIKLAGYTGTIQWEFSNDGENYAVAPYIKSGIYMNPSNATSFETTTSTGNAATYIVTNVTADTYFRAKITSGQCSSIYSSPVLYQNATEATPGTVSALSPSVCSGSSTALNLSGYTGTIVWQKSTDYLALLDPLLATWSTLTGTTSSVSTGNLSVSTAYRAKVSIGPCSTLYSDIFTVGVNKAIAKSITKDVTSPSGNTSTTQLCSNFSTPKTLTIGTGYVGDITWQHSTNNTDWTTIEGATSTNYIIGVASIGANYYRAKFSVASCSPDAYSPSVVVYYKSCVNRMGDTVINEEMRAEPVFSVVAYPNPSATIFTLELLSSIKGKSIGLKVYDMIGRLIEQRQIQQAGLVEIGAEYPPGIYNVVVEQDTLVKTLRVIKK
jgi:hypothetical protein